MLMRDSGEQTDDWEVIGEEAFKYFSDLFRGLGTPPDPVEFGLFDKVVTCEENVMLTCLPDEEEVKNVIRWMKEDGAPGPDELPARFHYAILPRMRRNCDCSDPAAAPKPVAPIPLPSTSFFSSSNSTISTFSIVAIFAVVVVVLTPLTYAAKTADDAFSFSSSF